MRSHKLSLCRLDDCPSYAPPSLPVNLFTITSIVNWPFGVEDELVVELEVGLGCSCYVLDMTAGQGRKREERLNESSYG